MKTKQTSLLYFLLIAILCVSACKNDDENEADVYKTTCCDIAPLEATVDGGKVYVPNAFTPNRDGINDIFLPQANAGIEEIVAFIIRDKDGAIVFENNNFLANNPQHGWDGKIPNGEIKEAIYTYTISIRSTTGVEEVFTGTVCNRGAESIICVDSESECAYSTQHDGMGAFIPDLPTFEICE